MLYDYRKESKSPMLLTLANGKTIEANLLIADCHRNLTQG